MQETHDEILQPELMLPAQYFHRHQTTSAEHRLLLAILLDAIHCYLEKTGKEAEQAEYWFTNSHRNSRDCITSDQAICEALSIDASALWAGLRKMLREESGDKPKNKCKHGVL